MQSKTQYKDHVHTSNLILDVKCTVYLQCLPLN